MGFFYNFILDCKDPVLFQTSCEVRRREYPSWPKKVWEKEGGPVGGLWYQYRGLSEDVRFEVWDDVGRAVEGRSLESCHSHFLSSRAAAAAVGVLSTKLLFEIFVAEVVVDGLVAEVVLHLVRDKMSATASHVFQKGAQIDVVL